MYRCWIPVRQNEEVLNLKQTYEQTKTKRIAVCNDR